MNDDTKRYCFRCGEASIEAEARACPSCGEKSLLTLVEALDLLNDLYVRGKFKMGLRYTVANEDH